MKENSPPCGVPAEMRAGTPRQGFYARCGKRIVDAVCSAIGLLVLLPLFVVVALCIKATSRGAVFYRQIRIGQNGHPFRIVKFRSMDDVASRMPAGITVSGDKRVTRVGRILRRHKVDELPQLWNVLRGEMSLVGPRPELPKYVASYSTNQTSVLAVRPGITDPASLIYRHEEEILLRHENPEQVYRDHILPDKLARNLAYIQNISFRSDLRIILATIGRSFLGNQPR
jgi:lipopolysaccharide/colanic/teichoic acid biosynthesis glycosyltransferase